MEYYKMTAYELSKQLQEKKISSAELTAAVFERIEQTEEKVDAYITLNKEAALRKAAEVDKKRSENAEMSNLAGIPIGIKDNICTKDVLTTCASKMLSNFVPTYNATILRKPKIRLISPEFRADPPAEALPLLPPAKRF